MIEQGSAPEEQGIGMIETGKCHAPPVTSSIRAHRWRLVLQREQPKVVRTQGDVPEGGGAQMPIDAARAQFLNLAIIHIAACG